ncbi:MAG: FAD:protein FMN transferase [Oscillospiraceae bacterium]|nr:FAD:protein FMN transferase [Oscillospiraceae bacterium]
MKILQKFGILTVLAVMINLSACNMDSNYSSEFFCMDTPMSITAYGSNSENAVNEAKDKIIELDGLLAVDKKSSEVHILNRDKSLKGSKDIINLVKRSKEISEQTKGAFDITTSPLTELWGFRTYLQKKVPTENEINNALKSVSSNNIQINKDKITLENNASVDFGGIAKGYASGKVKEIFEKNNIQSGLISLGGNVRAIGKKPDGSNWTVGIADPDNTTEQIGVLSVNDTAVITSGGYQRNFTEKGKTYHHIIDPKSGYPADSGLKSVTVVSKDDTLADALSTALFVMGLEKAVDFFKGSGLDFGAVFITDNDEIFITDNLNNSFTAEKSFEVIAK